MLKRSGPFPEKSREEKLSNLRQWDYANEGERQLRLKWGKEI